MFHSMDSIPSKRVTTEFRLIKDSLISNFLIKNKSYHDMIKMHLKFL